MVRFRLLSLVVSVFLAVAIAPVWATTTAKAGRPCSKIDSKVVSKGSTLVCSKVKGKLTWVAKANNAPAPSPKPTVTTRSIPAEVLFGQQLLEQIAAKADTAPKFGNYDLEVEPVLKGTMWERTQTEGLARSFAYLYALDLVPTKRIRIYVNWTDEWLKDRLTSAGSSCANMSFAGGSFCAGENPTAFANAGWFARNWRLTIDAPEVPSEYLIGLVGNMPHELAHAGQIRGHEKYGNGNWKLVPAWLREGWADLFKVIYYADSRRISFAEAHKNFVRQSSTSCGQYSIRDLSSTGSHPEQSYCEYTNGYFATLKLLQITGNVDLQFRLPGSSGNTQAEAFQTTFAVDYEKFVEMADAFTRQALGDRSWW